MGEILIMKTCENRIELATNLETLESYRNSEDPFENEFYLSLVRNGRCFVFYQQGTKPRFAPSRFIGYKGNTMEQHNANKTKDGRITNPAICAVLHSPCEFNEELDRLYCTYCLSLGYAPLNFKRKYWSF